MTSPVGWRCLNLECFSCCIYPGVLFLDVWPPKAWHHGGFFIAMRGTSMTHLVQEACVSWLSRSRLRRKMTRKMMGQIHKQKCEGRGVFGLTVDCRINGRIPVRFHVSLNYPQHLVLLLGGVVSYRLGIRRERTVRATVLSLAVT